MDLYQEQIIDLAKNPIHCREMGDATHTHSGVNVTCGDHVRMYLNVEGDRIKEASWQGEGCAISLASVGMLCDRLSGMTVTEARALQNQDMFKQLGVDSLGPARVKCAVLCLETMQEALCDE